MLESKREKAAAEHQAAANRLHQQLAEAAGQKEGLMSQLGATQKELAEALQQISAVQVHCTTFSPCFPPLRWCLSSLTCSTDSDEDF